MTSKIFSALFVGLLLFMVSKYPLVSRSWGGLADMTFAIAHQDMPSGVYYDRDFDWPTGEALWIDVPVWSLDLALLCAAALCAWVAYRRKRQPNQALQATAAAPGC
jgi:hypothetical protein